MCNVRRRCHHLQHISWPVTVAKPTMWKTSLPMSMPIDARGDVTVSMGCFSGCCGVVFADYHCLGEVTCWWRIDWGATKFRRSSAPIKGPISLSGTKRTCRHRRSMSVVGVPVNSENICSQRVFRLLTLKRTLAAGFGTRRAQSATKRLAIFQQISSRPHGGILRHRRSCLALPFLDPDQSARQWLPKCWAVRKFIRILRERVAGKFLGTQHPGLEEWFK